MPSLDKLAGLPSRLHLPRRTVRLRLTVLYGCLFLVSGAGLLAITYFLVRGSTGSVLYLSGSTSAPVAGAGFQGVIGGGQVKGNPVVTIKKTNGALSVKGLPGVTGRTNVPGSLGALPVSPKQAQAQARQLAFQATNQHAAELHQLLVKSGIALAIMALVSIALGWLISGRVLRPLRTMTAATRRISEDNLHQRLALEGPDDELKDLADTIDGLLGRLEAAFEAQRRFVANASHELRTPLAMMRTSLDVAVAKPDPVSPQVGVLENKLREGLDQADRLLESFLVLARAQHGALSDRTTVSLPQILSAAIEARGPAIAEKSIEIQQSIGDISVTGSETLLSRMVENVIENAIRHNEDRGWIRIETDIDGAVVRVTVESGGPHLDESRVRELAQPFRRLGAERIGSEDGVGLGLSIVAAIAAAHGGALELHALPRGGLRVQIELAGGVRMVAAGSPA